MENKNGTTEEQDIVTAEDLRESAMKCAEVGCFGIGDGVAERDKLENKLKEYIKNNPERTFKTAEEWVRNMTPEQRKEYCQSLAQKAAMEMVPPTIGLKDVEKLGD